MATATDLRDVSDAASRWIELLCEVSYWGAFVPTLGNAISATDAAKVLLAKLCQLRSELERYGQALDAEADRFAAASDEIVHYNGLVDEPKPYTSSHEAITSIARRAVWVLLGTFGYFGRDLPDNWQQTAVQQLTPHWRRFALDASLMQARIRRERVKLFPANSSEPLAASENEQGSTADKTVTYPTIEEHMERLAQAVGDENAVEIMKIASRKDWPGERRMEEILKLDRRFKGKNSPEWGRLLGVEPAAIRGYGIWKQIRRDKRAGY